MEKDRGLMYNLRLAKHLIDNCNLLGENNHTDLVNEILIKCNSFLLHVCDEIGHISATIIGLYVNHLKQKCEKNEKVKYLSFVKDLADSCCRQLNRFALCQNFIFSI